MDFKGLRVTQNAYFFTSDAYQAIFINDILWHNCGNWKTWKCDRRCLQMEGQTDVKVEIVDSIHTYIDFFDKKC